MTNDVLPTPGPKPPNMNWLPEEPRVRPSTKVQMRLTLNTRWAGSYNEPNQAVLAWLGLSDKELADYNRRFNVTLVPGWQIMQAHIFKLMKTNPIQTLRVFDMTGSDITLAIKGIWP